MVDHKLYLQFFSGNYKFVIINKSPENSDVIILRMLK